MFYDIFYYAFIGGLLYVFYLKIVKFYFIYWTYTKQGIPSVGMPIPFYGNLIQQKKIIDSVPTTIRSPLEDYWNKVFKNNLPKIFIEVRGVETIIVIQDLDIVHELMGPKNKFLDNSGKNNKTYKVLFGESLLYDKNGELANLKLKSL